MSAGAAPEAEDFPEYPDPGDQGWPTPANEAADTPEMELFKAKVTVRVAQAEEEADLRKANEDANLADIAAFSDRYTTLVAGAIERRQDAAKTVQSAASIIATLYTGALAVSFSVTDFRMPPRGVLAPIFLGLAVVLSTYYLAWIDRETDSTAPATSGSQPIEDRVAMRAAAIGRIAQRAVLSRGRALRASVLALGVGLVYLVLPFVTLGGGDAESDAGDWPAAVVAEGENPELVALRYAEQLKDVAAAREADAASDPVREWIVILVAAVVGGAVLVFGSRRDDA